MDITKISIDELMCDRNDSEDDIKICQKALAVGVTHHRDGFSGQKRIDTNRDIIAKIDAEIARRNTAGA